MLRRGALFLCLGFLLFSITPTVGAQSFFVRGDCNAGGDLGLTDIIFLLSRLFTGGDAPTCDDACDYNNDESLGITDAIYGLNYLFTGGAPPETPFPACGRDTGAGETLSCATFDPCGTLFLLDPPLVDSLPLTTGDIVVILSGLAPGADEVEIVNASNSVTTATNPDDSFSTPFILSSNRLNVLSFTAVKDSGQPTEMRSAPAVRTVSHDGTPPSIQLTTPIVDATDTHNTFAPLVTFSGYILEPLSGIGNLTLTVDGNPVTLCPAVGNLASFSSQVILNLAPSLRDVDIVATDAVGNSTSITVHVDRSTLPPGVPHLQLDPQSDSQSTLVLATTDEPIRIFAFDATGLPLQGALITFEVVQSNGRLGAAENVIHTDITNSSGVAEVSWRLGSTAGASSDRVFIRGPVGLFANDLEVFASATPNVASHIAISSGNYQIAETSVTAPQPLVVSVSDGVNRVSGVPVTFTVVAGGGQVAGNTSFVVSSDANGLASVDYVMGASAGTNCIEASTANTSLPVTFSLQGVTRVPGAPTNFSGQVVDGDGMPLAGVPITLEAPPIPGLSNLNTTTDILGEFEFLDVDFDGFTHLFVNGQALAPAGSYPDLEFLVLLIPNADNVMPFAVSLPFLPGPNSALYSETEDVFLTHPRIPGLELLIEAGSMMINGNPPPAGQIVSITPVKESRLPMRLPDGATPALAFTFQPPNATFDPPVHFCYPNLGELAPRQIGFLSSFNHDTGRFEIIGTGSVDLGGARISSNDGSGLSHGGWNAFVPPYGPQARVSSGANALFDANSVVSFDPTFQSIDKFTVNADGSFSIGRALLSRTTESNLRVYVRTRDQNSQSFSYYVSDRFDLSDGQTHTPSFTGPFTNPPARIVDIPLQPLLAELNSIGEQLQLSVPGEYDNGSTADITAGSTGTWYRSTNSDIVSVSSEGLVTAVSEGAAFLMIRNGEEFAVMEIKVDLQQGTVITGSVEFAGGTPADGATVVARVGFTDITTTTAPDGTFSLTNIPAGPVSLVASFFDPSPLGARLNLPSAAVVADSTTDIGVLTLAAVTNRYVINPGEGTVGGTAEVSVLMDTVIDVAAWDVSICHPAEISSVSLDVPNEELYGFVGSIISVDTVTLGVLVDVGGGAPPLLPVVGMPILDITYSLDLAPGGSSEYSLMFCDSGFPVIINQVVTPGVPVSILVALEDGTITVVP